MENDVGIEVIVRRGVIRSAPSRFMEQYGGHYPDDKPLPWKYGETKRETFRRLGEINVDTCAPEDIDVIIGNKSWTRLECEVCGETVEVVVRVGEEPDCDSRWVDLCAACLTKAALMLSKAIKAVHEDAVES